MEKVSVFKTENSLEKRIDEANRVLNIYPDRIPCIVETFDKRNEISSEKPDVLEKIKYLIPKHMTAGQLIFIIKKRTKISPEQSIFLFVGKSREIPLLSDELISLYKKHREQDGFLYIVYSFENTFGA